ncbi:preprotein translocase subunit SecY [Salmonella enterica subsp. enterica serovar Brijbhumi]|nr:preprotein translocase subunit SecY [Salmonella enterica subsp. enterica serovar Brijbhumi]
MNFAEIHVQQTSNVLIRLKKTHALGRSLMIFKMPASRC